MKAPWTRLAAPLAGEQAAEVVPEVREGWEVVWIVATPGEVGSEKWAFDTEREAEAFAGELVKGRRAEFAVTYRTTVEIEGDVA